MAINQITVASAQFAPQIFDKEQNMTKIELLIQRAVRDMEADLVVFPEGAVAGYCFRTFEETMEAAIEKDGSEIERIRALSHAGNISIVFGSMCHDGGTVYNAVFMAEPDGSLFSYYKSHLPFLGADRFVKAGDEPCAVFNSRFGKLGIIVCYELRFPETARIAALHGARIILQPTNLPLGGESHPDFLTRARACENRVHFISSNRCGEERGFRFLGRSQIVDLDGNVLAECGEEEGMISATLDLTLAEDKDIIGKPGERELYLFRDRRWELYKDLGRKGADRGVLD